MSTVQCYTPSGGPSCRTQGFCHSYPALVACRQQGLLFCLLLGFQSVVPSGVAGCRPSGLSTARTILLSSFGFRFACVSRALSAQQGLFFWFLFGLWVVHCHETKTNFSSICGFGPYMYGKLTSAIVWRLSWFNKIKYKWCPASHQER